MPSLMTLFSLLQEARMAAKLLEKKFGIKDVSWRKTDEYTLDQSMNQSNIKVTLWMKLNTTE